MISLLLLSYEHFASCLLGNARKWKEKGVILFYLIIIGSLGEKLKEVYINLIKVIFYKVKLENILYVTQNNNKTSFS